jgi:hypothetical protein
VTEDVIVGNITLSASVGFDETGRPAEIFLSGAKDGSGLAAILEDASVVISVALQYARTRERSQKRVFRPVRLRERRAGRAPGRRLELHQMAFCLARRRRMYSAIKAL